MKKWTPENAILPMALQTKRRSTQLIVPLSSIKGKKGTRTCEIRQRAVTANGELVWVSMIVKYCKTFTKPILLMLLHFC